MSQAWLDQRERGMILGIRMTVSLAMLLGRPLARLLLYPGCLYFMLFSVKARAASRDYLRRVLPHQPTLLDVFRHYYSFAAVALDRVYLLKGRDHLFNREIHGEDLLRKLFDRGQGCLLLGAHLGSFEILRALGTAHDLEVGVVMYEDNSRMISAVARAINPELAKNVIVLGRYDSMLKVHESLQHSSWVGILGDRALDVEGQRQVSFLGGVASFPVTPFRLSLILKRPVVLMVGLYRGGNRYELHFEKLFDPAEVERGGRSEAVDAALQRYVGRIEHYCRQAPYNWFNFYAFWDRAR